MKKLIVFLSFVGLVTACSTDDACSGSVHVKMRNKTGLDGCGWVLQLNDNSYLEAQNLNDFEIEFVEGKDLHVKYEEVNGGSVCMVGKIVKITCLTED
jgi:hypothetical protein